MQRRLLQAPFGGVEAPDRGTDSRSLREALQGRDGDRLRRYQPGLDGGGELQDAAELVGSLSPSDGALPDRVPPVGFYLPKTVDSPNGHLFDRTYHEANEIPLREGWRWYCAFVKEGTWQPSWGRYANDWRKGDNLWDYFTLVGEVLAGNAD